MNTQAISSHIMFYYVMSCKKRYPKRPLKNKIKKLQHYVHQLGYPNVFLLPADLAAGFSLYSYTVISWQLAKEETTKGKSW